MIAAPSNSTPESATMSEDIQYKLGDLAARIRNLEDTSERLEGKMDTMQDTMNQALGGFKALRIAGALAVTLAGLIGGFVAKFVNWVNS